MVDDRRTELHLVRENDIPKEVPSLLGRLKEEAEKVNNGITALIAQRDEAYAQIRELTEVMGKAHEAIVMLKDENDALRRQLERARAAGYVILE